MGNNLMFLYQPNDIRRSQRSVYLREQVKKWKWLFKLSHHLPQGTEENQEKQVSVSVVLQKLENDASRIDSRKDMI